MLYGSDSATAKQCAEWLADVNEFERLCASLGKDHRAYIDDCRCHFDHYAHHLGRRRRFTNCELYILDRGGPLKVRSWRKGNG